MRKNFVFFTGLLILALGVVLFLTFVSHHAQGKEVEIKDDEPFDIYLWLYDDPDDIMKTEQQPPDADVQGVTSKTWIYGLDTDGEKFHGDFLLYDNIGGDEKGVMLYLTVQNPSSISDVDVTFQLKDDGEVIAEGSDTLNAGFPDGEERSEWELVFTGAAAGLDSYLIEEGSYITLEMSTDGNQVNIHYGNNMNDKYYLRFKGIQFYQLEIRFWRIYQNEPPVEITSDNSNDNYKYFRPNEIKENAKVYINGSLKDSLGSYDVREIAVEFYFEGEPVEDPGNGIADLTSVAEEGVVNFEYVWDYADIEGLEDGDYTLKLILKDQMDRDNHPSDFKYGETIFKMSHYGTYLAPEEGDSFEKKVSAGEYVEFNIRVYNTGLEEDTFSLEYDLPTGGWVVTLKQGESEVSEVSVDAENTENEPTYVTVTLNISVPADAPEGRKAINFKSTSQGSGVISHQVSVVVDVSPKTGVEVYFLDGAKKVYQWNETAEKGKEKDISFYISNGGTATDTFLLQWDDKPADWNFWFVDPETEEIIESKKVTIEPQREREIWFRVRPAESLQSVNEADITLTARSENNSETSASIELHITRTLGVLVETEQNKEMTPGIINTLIVWVENTGDESHTFELSTVLPTEMTGWTVSIEDETLTIEAGGKESTELSITPPSSAEAKDEGYTFKIKAVAQDDTNIYFEVETTVFIKVQYEFSVEPQSAEKKIDAGEKAEYVITVQNTGNKKITVNLRIDTEASEIKDGWKATLDYYFKELEPQEIASFILSVEAPDDAKDGEETTVVVSVSIQEDPQMAPKTVTTKTTAEKGMVASFFDSLKENFLFVIFIIVGIGIVIVYGVMTRMGEEEFEEEEEDYYYEDVEDAEDAEEYI